MKKSINFLAAVVLMLICVFSFTACDSGKTGGSHTHNWEDWVETTASTITTDGTETRTCLHDSSHKETRTLYATGTVGLEYNLINNGTEYEVAKGTVTDSEIFIPAYHNNKPVTSISDDAFSFYGYLEEIIFLNGSLLENIGDGAFDRCVNLKSIEIPATVTEIGNNAFYGCWNIESLDFASESLIAKIGNSAFYNCTSIETIVIPSSVDSMGSDAFAYWTNLQAICLEGFVSHDNAVAFWGINWDNDCAAIISYLG